MEGDISLKQKGVNNDVVLEIQVPGSVEKARKSSDFQEKSDYESTINLSRAQTNLFISPPTPTQFFPSEPPTPTLDFSSKPPIVPLVRRRSLSRSAYSKPKSRIVEPAYSTIPNPIEKNVQTTPSKSPARNSLSSKVNSTTPRTSAPITPRTPLMPSIGDDDEDDDDEEDEVYKPETLKLDQVKHGKRVKVIRILEWIIFISLTTILVTSLTINKLESRYIWRSELWKWCVLVLVIFCGRLFTEWLTNGIVFLIEQNFMLKKKVLYFVFALKKSVRVVIWLAFILLAWALLIERGVARSESTSRILRYITRGIISTLVGSVMWMVKTLLVKIVASSFHVRTFFDRIQESIFHQYILQALSGNPMAGNENIKSTCQLSFSRVTAGKEVKKGEVINVDKLYKMKREKVSSWTMGGLIKIIRNSELPSISEVLDESVEKEWGEPKVISSEVDAKDAANRIFRNVAKPHHKYIDEDDLLVFMPKEEVDNAIPLFEGATESRRIKKSAFRNWVVKAYNERKYLAVSLSDSKTAIEELNRVASGLILFVITIVWLLLMEIATTRVLIFISSQLLLVVFMFGNTLKMLFESMIFVFVVHPFDVGDRCVIDGNQMIVEEMNILTTIFLKTNNEKLYFPNSVLATKPISNYNRSPEMGDSVEFAVDFSTSVESIAALKDKIKIHLESKPTLWSPNHSVQIKEIVNVNKMLMALYVTHTINFQNTDRGNRRSDLVLQLKKIFEELGIIYRLLPQEVQITYPTGTR